MSSRHARRISTPLPYLGKLTLSAGVITDVTRLAGVEGDGEAYPASSVYVGPAYTQYIKNTQAVTNVTGWAVNGTGADAPARTTALAKFGSTSVLIGGTGLASTQGGTYSGTDNGSAAVGETWTAVVWVYVASGTVELLLVMSERDAGGTGLADGISGSTNVSQGWTKLTYTYTLTNASVSKVYLKVVTASNPGFTWQAYVQANLFKSSIALPYLVADGGTASRVAGDCYATTFSSLVNPTKGWMFVRGRFGVSDAAAPAGAHGLAECNRSDGTSRTTLTWTPAMNQLNVARVGGGSSGSLGGSPAITPALGDYVTAGMGWSASLIGTATNGNAFNTQADTNIGGAFDRITFGSRRAGSSPFYGDILWAVIGSEDTWDTALSVLMHSFGNNDPLPHQIPRRYGPVVLATMNGDGTMYRYSA